MEAVMAAKRMGRASATPCLDEFERLVAQCRAKARNAARRSKPTMWAYYERMVAEVSA